MNILVTILCTVILVALVAALIFSAKFRQDILGGSGEARVLGILSVKGAAVVLLVGIFFGGLIWSVPENNLAEKSKPQKELRGLQEDSLRFKLTIDSLNKALNDYKTKNQKQDTIKQILEKEIENLKAEKKMVDGRLKDALQNIRTKDSSIQQLNTKLAKAESATLKIPEDNNIYSITLHVSNECELLRTSIERALREIKFRISDDPVLYQPSASVIVYHKNDAEIKKKAEYIRGLLKSKFNFEIEIFLNINPSREREIKISLR